MRGLAVPSDREPAGTDPARVGGRESNGFLLAGHLLASPMVQLQPPLGSQQISEIPRESPQTPLVFMRLQSAKPLHSQVFVEASQLNAVDDPSPMSTATLGAATQHMRASKVQKERRFMEILLRDEWCGRGAVVSGYFSCIASRAAEDLIGT